MYSWEAPVSFQPQQHPRQPLPQQSQLRQHDMLSLGQGPAQFQQHLQQLDALQRTLPPRGETSAASGGRAASLPPSHHRVAAKTEALGGAGEAAASATGTQGLFAPQKTYAPTASVGCSAFPSASQNALPHHGVFLPTASLGYPPHALSSQDAAAAALSQQLLHLQLQQQRQSQYHHHHQQQQLLLQSRRQQPPARYESLDPYAAALGGPYTSVPFTPQFVQTAAPASYSHEAQFVGAGFHPQPSSMTLSSTLPSAQPQWHFSSNAFQLAPAQVGVNNQRLSSSLRTNAAFPYDRYGGTLRPQTLRFVGDLHLLIPDREPFLGEAGGVQLCLLGLGVSHRVCRDVGQCLEAASLLEERRELPPDSPWPLLLHEGKFVASGVEPCLRFISRRLGRYGSDCRKDAVLDRLLGELGRWADAQIRAIVDLQQPTPAEQRQHSNVSTREENASAANWGAEVESYLSSRRICYLAADRLLEFYRSSQHAGAGESLNSFQQPESAWRETEAATNAADDLHEEAPFFFGGEESAADFFLFALLDDDQRIAQCVASRGGGETPALNFFSEAPCLQALYAALLRRPALEKALLAGESVEGCSDGAICKGSKASAPTEGGFFAAAPCVGTNASTAVSVCCDSPRTLSQHARPRGAAVETVRRVSPAENQRPRGAGAAASQRVDSAASGVAPCEVLPQALSPRTASRAAALQNQRGLRVCTETQQGRLPFERQQNHVPLGGGASSLEDGRRTPPPRAAAAGQSQHAAFARLQQLQEQGGQ